MNREVHVRFCERFGGVTPPYLLDHFIVTVQKDGYMQKKYQFLSSGKLSPRQPHKTNKEDVIKSSR
jgi:hypothetical protein